MQPAPVAGREPDSDASGQTKVNAIYVVGHHAEFGVWEASSFQLPAASWLAGNLIAESWKLEAGSWKLEA
jgi:SRSO17 transposase